MKILVVTGTRPNFVKEYAFSRACREAGVQEVLLHTGQHYDWNMSQSFFQELDLKRPDYINQTVKATPAKECAAIMEFMEAVLGEERPAVTVVFGDVTSTLAAAVASAKLGIPVAHIEAGVRSPLLYNPEEINRRVTDVLSHTLFPNTDEAYEALLREGHPPENVFPVGDIMYDSLLLAMSEHDIQLGNQGYLVLTLHRAENTDDPQRLRSIVQAILRLEREVRFPVHPRTERSLKKFGLWEPLQAADNLSLLPPLGYLDFLRLLAGADKVLSDSGGVRREAYMMTKPVISLTELVWVPAMVEAGWELVAGADEDKIVSAVKEFIPPDETPAIFGDGQAASRMVSILKTRYRDGRAGANLSTTGIANPNSLVAEKVEAAYDLASITQPLPGGRRKVSLVIPCYNEEDSLPTLFYRLDNLASSLDHNRYRLELVLVNDGSRDATPTMLQNKFQNHPRARLVMLPENHGFGGALKAGLEAAQGDIVVTIDADTNYDIMEVPKLLEYMQEGVDVVTGSPFAEGGQWNYPFHRYILSRAVVGFYRWALGPRAGDIKTFTCGFRAYRRETLPLIWPEADDFLATAEMLIRALLAGLRVEQYPTTIYERKFGRSKLKLLPTIRRHLGMILSLKFRDGPPKRKNPPKLTISGKKD